MSAENKALERRMYDEVYVKKNAGAIEQFLDRNWVCHPTPPGMAPGIEGMKQWHAMSNAALPDMRVKLEDMIAEGDKVACRWTATGTHRGEFMGVPATGKQVTITGMHIDRISGGKVVETWNLSDMLGVMQQLGIKPPG